MSQILIFFVVSPAMHVRHIGIMSRLSSSTLSHFCFPIDNFRGAVGSSLTGVTALWPLSKTHLS